MSRPSKDQWLMSVAMQTAMRTTCYRGPVGCVLVDADSQILSTGYNGVPKGLPHCDVLNIRRTQVDKNITNTVYDYPHACPGADAINNPDGCEAVHAEINALLQCADVSRIASCYCTTEPCFRCCKALLNTGVQRVLFITRNGAPEAEQLWRKTWEARGVDFVVWQREPVMDYTLYRPDP